ncbi:MAG TPA: lipopolysaccharide assembly protein LapB [Novimethylophilus sp.]|jgi:lipopolysaccharide biosynthesis regulator YciM|uniref:lipopolysaccharide assembly protein LapB n=1 Tax=Novimethylophilus sp. TaxID=2137426 RepID=UPI002F41AB8B
MDFEYWWLLTLPFFFGLGWIAARIDIGQLLTETSTLPASYFRGLNFLISEQPDKAIEAFTEALRADSNTLELHFALGSLFRRTGEMDRAIRLHQGLLDRENLGEPQKLMALAELAQDYLKAGLFDRAEEIFIKLTETRYANSALRALLEIYVREKEWSQAISAAQRLEALTGKPLRMEVAQFHCELAQQQILLGQIDQARVNLAEALETNRDCVRANVMLGDLEAACGDHAKALAAWRAIELQIPDYIELVAERMMMSWRSLGKTEGGLSWLQDVVRKYQLGETAQVLFEATLDLKGPEAAYRMAHEEAEQSPTLTALDRLLQAKVSGMPDGDLRLVMGAIRENLEKTAFHRCTTCGYTARQFHWHCPSCSEWETFPPRFERAVS